jgi:hypothetical protein
MDRAIEHLTQVDRPPSGRTLLVRGDSGTGKSYFSRELMHRLGQTRPDSLFLYVDVADDEFQSSRTLAALLRMALVPGPMTETSVVNVPEPLSLARYRKRMRKQGMGRGAFRALAQAVGMFLGLGKAVGAALESVDGEAAALEDELAAYLAWAARQGPIFVAIDNLQFLNLEIRLTIESVLQRVDRAVRLIAVDRTVDDQSELDPEVRCFGDRLMQLRLGTLTAAETRQLVEASLGDGDDSARLSEDIFTKTGGLAKDIDYCLRRYVLELGHGAQATAIDGLLVTIDKLPLIHRQFLVIATLLNGGLKREIALRVVRRLSALYEDSNLDRALDELLASEYLRLNGESGDRVRPGHERIAIAMNELADDDLQEEVRKSLIEELASALDEPGDAGENETYLLHCLIGVQTARELSRNLQYISRLIQSQYRQDQFSYLVAISAELQEILPMLPENVLGDLLDAMQKSFAFYEGLSLVRLLDKEGVPGADERRIFRLRYLTQAYDYDEALSLSEEIGAEGWGAVYRINALMSLHRNQEARVIADAQLLEEVDECQAVLRRNTITLFDPDAALLHLDQAYEFFEREQSEYRLATIDTNRSLVHIHRGDFGDALRCLEIAMRRMNFVKSREVFQAQINLAVRAALLGKYDTALDWLAQASLRVPRALLLDRAKIEMDRIVIEAIAGRVTLVQAQRELENCLRGIQGVQMPEIRSSLVPNLAIARGEYQPADDLRALPMGSELGMSIPIEAPSGTTWSLLMSVHWRY